MALVCRLTSASAITTTSGPGPWSDPQGVRHPRGASASWCATGRPGFVILGDQAQRPGRRRLWIGDSIAVNGVCLTVISFSDSTFPQT